MRVPSLSEKEIKDAVCASFELGICCDWLQSYLLTGDSLIRIGILMKQLWAQEVRMICTRSARQYAQVVWTVKSNTVGWFQSNDAKPIKSTLSKSDQGSNWLNPMTVDEDKSRDDWRRASNWWNALIIEHCTEHLLKMLLKITGTAWMCSPDELYRIPEP